MGDPKILQSLPGGWLLKKPAFEKLVYIGFLQV
jgi:hypothetical protein